MWKYTSRRIKSIFCKHQSSRHSVTTKEARNSKTVDCVRNLSPALFHQSHLSYCWEGEKGESFAQNKKRNPKADKRNLFNYFHNVLDALQWGTFCTLGFYIVQSFSHGNFQFNREQLQKYRSHALTKYVQNEYLQLLNYLTNVQPILHIFPESKAIKPIKKDGVHDNEVHEFEFDNLEKAHNSVMGSLSNFHGTDCFSRGNYKEAIRHFEEAAVIQHPAAIYNLGVCYEIGLGTEKDLKKAAEMYKRASDLGHPTATYNLGVFHVHGLGDLKADLNAARKLFEIAASQGQPNAVKALEMEKNEVVAENIDEHVTDLKSKNFTSTSDKHVKLSSRKPEKFGFVTDSFFNTVISGKMDVNCASLDDSGALDLTS